ncbi:hypothetical protein GBA52_016348 [Prunus armeniaca]|nr:hypothetical protein GBA52_016348 [Prunus armeniaca]
MGGRIGAARGKVGGWGGQLVASHGHPPFPGPGEAIGNFTPSLALINLLEFDANKFCYELNKGD